LHVIRPENLIIRVFIRPAGRINALYPTDWSSDWEECKVLDIERRGPIDVATGEIAKDGKSMLAAGIEPH